MKEFLFDSSVLLDLATHDQEWAEWSRNELRAASARGSLLVNPIIYAEVAPAFKSDEALDAWFAASVFRRVALPYPAAWRASEAFVRYRRAGGVRLTPMPDFYIGAHAEVEGLTLVTRDAARIRTYFPKVRLIAPTV